MSGKAKKNATAPTGKPKLSKSKSLVGETGAKPKIAKRSGSTTSMKDKRDRKAVKATATSKTKSCYSLYSEESESDRVTSASRGGIDRCSELLYHLLDRKKAGGRSKMLSSPCYGKVDELQPAGLTSRVDFQIKEPDSPDTMIAALMSGERNTPRTRAPVVDIKTPFNQRLMSSTPDPDKCLSPGMQLIPEKDVDLSNVFRQSAASKSTNYVVNPMDLSSLVIQNYSQSPNSYSSRRSSHRDRMGYSVAQNELVLLETDAPKKSDMADFQCYLHRESSKGLSPPLFLQGGRSDIGAMYSVRDQEDHGGSGGDHGGGGSGDRCSDVGVWEQNQNGRLDVGAVKKQEDRGGGHDIDVGIRDQNRGGQNGVSAVYTVRKQEDRGGGRDVDVGIRDQNRGGQNGVSAVYTVREQEDCGGADGVSDVGVIDQNLNGCSDIVCTSATGTQNPGGGSDLVAVQTVNEEVQRSHTDVGAGGTKERSSSVGAMANGRDLVDLVPFSAEGLKGHDSSVGAMASGRDLVPFSTRGLKGHDSNVGAMGIGTEEDHHRQSDVGADSLVGGLENIGVGVCSAGEQENEKSNVYDSNMESAAGVYKTDDDHDHVTTANAVDVDRNNSCEEDGGLDEMTPTEVTATFSVGTRMSGYLGGESRNTISSSPPGIDSRVLIAKTSPGHHQHEPRAILGRQASKSQPNNKLNSVGFGDTPGNVMSDISRVCYSEPGQQLSPEKIYPLGSGCYDDEECAVLFSHINPCSLNPNVGISKPLPFLHDFVETPANSPINVSAKMNHPGASRFDTGHVGTYVGLGIKSQESCFKPPLSFLQTILASNGMDTPVNSPNRSPVNSDLGFLHSEELIQRDFPKLPQPPTPDAPHGPSHVRFLLKELENMAKISGSSDMLYLVQDLNNTLETMSTLDLVNVDKLVQHLRIENVQLNRRIKTLNQQLRERERMERESSSLGVNFELLNLQTDNVSLNRQLREKHEAVTRFMALVDELQHEKDQVKEERQQLIMILDEKNKDKLKLREECMQESSKLERQLDLMKKQNDGNLLKLKAAQQENNILDLALKQRDHEISRLEQLVQTLKDGVEGILGSLDANCNIKGPRSAASDTFNLQRMLVMLDRSASPVKSIMSDPGQQTTVDKKKKNVPVSSLTSSALQKLQQGIAMTTGTVGRSLMQTDVENVDAKIEQDVRSDVSTVSSFSTSTTVDDRAFQEGIAALDANIAKVQLALQRTKKKFQH
ncbi:uncharacterized protein LOC121387038 isoform X2 [Gigantopelta aegis]|uniref:uncharacterized protein LOC121387038 isoform X2 n=1 Tax=Gigantopelta aegis TaxID=1735272 RepID=UPI001B888CFE|nr:uncharacterized protein LOC121387038 isoform X2 [Gigantopelta aegis]